MNTRKLSLQMIGMTLVLLFLIGCDGPEATPAPPTANPTKAFKLATSAEEIVGTWHVGGYPFIRFDEAGIFRQAKALDNLDSLPYAINSYRFEGTNLLITEISVSGVPTCGTLVGTYAVRLLESGNIRIVPITDQCGPRASDIAGEYEPIR